MVSFKRFLRLSMLMAILVPLGVIEAYAQISASVTEGCAPLIGVEFEHSFTNATNILWTFGNGTSATTDAPTNTYQTPGVYTVTFTADPGISETLTITVLASPEASFEPIGSTSGCIPLVVSFNDTSIPADGATITNWSWDFGDGGVDITNNPDPTYTYTLVGVNDVTLVVEDNNGCESAFGISDLIVASIPPDLTLNSNPNPTSACTPPLTVDFQVDGTSNSPQTGSLTYDWNLDGEPFDGANPDPITWDEDGSYPISVTITDDAGCSSTQNTNVFIGSPQADWELIGGPSYCDTVFFENLSDPASTTISWGNGDSDFTTNPDDTLMYVFDSPGTYTAAITTSSPGCESTDEVTVVIDEIVADFVSTPNFSCNPTLTTTYTSTSVGAESYLWIFGNDSIEGVSETDYTHVSQAIIDPYAGDGPQLFGGQLIVTSAAGCQDETSIFVDTIWVPYAAFAVDIDDGCAPLNVTFSDSSSSPTPIVSWEYHMGDGTIITVNDTDQVNYTYPTDGDFESFVVITTEEGCTDTSFVIPINVGTQVSPDLDFGPVQVCPGEEVDFSALNIPGIDTDMWTIQSDENTISGCPYDPDFSGGYDSYAGSHDITLLVNYNGCVSSTTYSDAIEVLGPVGHFYSALNCENPYEVEFIGDITGADSWTYDFGDGQSFTSSSEQSTIHTYANTGDYQVVLTSVASTGCAPFQDTITVRIRDVEANLATPDLYCVEDMVGLDASASVDVFESNGDGYAWVFDPGMTPAPQRGDSPFFSFEEFNSGDFDISLIVFDVNGCSDTASTTLSVFGVEPEIGFEVEGFCIPMTVNFADLTETDTTVATWEWNFGLGNVSADSAITFTFGSEFTSPYSINLTVTDVLGCSGETDLILSPDIPNAAFSASDTQLCAGDGVVLSAQNQNYPYYEWEIETGQLSDQASFDGDFPNAGEYDVTLVVQNDAGCYDTLTVVDYISVQSYPNVGFSTNVDGLENLCYPILIEFTDTSNAFVFDYLDWDLGTGAPVVNNPTVGTIYEEPGIYTVSLEVGTTYGCIGNYSQDFIIEGPVADFILSTDEICLYDSVSMEIIDSTDVAYFTWEFGNGVDSSMVNPVTYYYDQIPAGGSTNIQLITWSADSACTATTEYPFQVNLTLAGFDRNNEIAFEDTVHCFGIPDTLTNTSVGGTDYIWYLGDGFFTISEDVVYNYPEGGMYDITLIASNTNTGCTDTISKPLQVYPEMNVSAPNGLACIEDTIFLAAYGGESYVWEPAEFVSDPEAQFPYLVGQQDQELVVFVTDTNNCTEFINLDANYIRPSIQPIWSDTIINFGTVVDFGFDPGPFQNHSWFTPSGLECAQCDQPNFSPNGSEIIGVSVTDELTCFIDTFYFQIEVLDELLFWMPNSFTPNEDGINDKFFPVMERALPEGYLFSIFNRYGELIWETDDINGKWQGNSEGSSYYAEPQLYVWKVRVQDLRSISYEFFGHVTLIR